ncbi:MAG TPA: 50S ribosomal protein L25 [Nevskiaceae bacterium]|nr:50S ribosomal protein L25 [Nevskiaceae bacterium]
MQDVTLKLEKREVTGKSVKHLRKQGQIPAVIHDHGKESLVVQADYQAIAKAYQDAGKHHPIQVVSGDKKYTTLIKAVSIDPKYNSITHVVFNAVKANQKVEAEIPVRIHFDEGNDATPAERAGLIVLHQLEQVEVEAIASKLPDFLEFDGEKLVAVGDHVTVADLLVPEGVIIKAESTQTLATVFEPSALAAANDAAGGTDEEETTEAAEGESEPTGEQPAEAGAEAKTEDKQ